jgi:uncharacterized protein (DUF952 family)
VPPAQPATTHHHGPHGQDGPAAHGVCLYAASTAIARPAARHRHDDHMTQPIFHITERPLWQRALRDGSYTYSTRGARLSDVGFIHCSFKHQVEAVADHLYGSWQDDLLLLQADPSAIPSEIRVEALEGGTDGFPHIYGPLPAEAVEAVYELVREAGQWRLPRGL